MTGLIHLTVNKLAYIFRSYVRIFYFALLLLTTFFWRINKFLMQFHVLNLMHGEDKIAHSFIFTLKEEGELRKESVTLFNNIFMTLICLIFD